MVATPVIDIYPATDFDDDLQNVRDALATGDNRMRLAEALREWGTKALVITPEYNFSRGADTGKSLVFHVLLEDRKIDARQMNQFEDLVEGILKQEGFVATFSRDHQPNLPLELTGSGVNPFSRAIESVSGSAPAPAAQPK
jgi:hypothetical protein